MKCFRFMFHVRPSEMEYVVAHTANSYNVLHLRILSSPTYMWTSTTTVSAEILAVNTFRLILYSDFVLIRRDLVLETFRNKFSYLNDFIIT